MSSQSGSGEIRELIRKVRLGDSRAADTLFRQYGAEIQTEIRRRLRRALLTSVLETDDVCQSVFGSFFVGLAVGRFEIREPADLSRLLCRIAGNKVVSHQRQELADRRDRRRTVQLPESGSADELSDSEPPADEIVELEDLVSVFRSRLTSKERRLADLRVDGKTWQAIGDLLEESPNALRKQLNRAVARVSESLGLDWRT